MDKVRKEQKRYFRQMLVRMWSNSTPRYLPSEVKTMFTENPAHEFYESFLNNCQQLGTTQVFSTGEQMNKLCCVIRWNNTTRQQKVMTY